MIMCVLCYPVSFHMFWLLLTGRPSSSFGLVLKTKWLPYHIFNGGTPASRSCRVIMLKGPYISLIIASGASKYENNL